MLKLTFVNFTTIEYFTSVNLSIFFINFCFVLTDNRAMNTTEQIIKVIEERLEALDMSKAELLRRSGQSQSLFVMALKRGSSFRIESLVEMSKVLNISLPVLLGELPTPFRVAVVHKRNKRNKGEVRIRTFIWKRKYD